MTATIETHGLTKRYGRTVAVDDLSISVRPGLITGFVGPNGAGKTTTMQLVLGLARADSGEALVDGRPYRTIPRPLTAVGALLDAGALHPSRSARNHLVWLARSNGIPPDRADRVLELVGLSGVRGRRAKALSLGMRQRLGVAAALLGEPPILLLDEPTIGLDPEGIQWMRELLRALAAEGRTVLVSSHLMSELEGTADHLIVIGRGRKIADMSTQEFVNQASGNVVRVRTPQAGALEAQVAGPGVTVKTLEPDVLEVRGLTARQIGEAAASNQIVLHELTPQQASLEEAFMTLTRDDVEFKTLEREEAAA